VFGSRRVAARGRRPAGRLARSAARACATCAAAAVILLGATDCEEARQGVDLIAAIDSLHPGSRIAVEEQSVDGVRTVEVTIRTREMAADVAELDRAARRVARAVRDHAGLRRGLDRVIVVYRSEGGRGFLSASRRARFTYRVVELGAE
jgi:hypothetical protein